MGLLKSRSKIGVLFLIALAVVTLIFYFSYLSPKLRAEHHLDFVHNSINDMHPAILEPNATEFHHWHKNGYQEARKLLSQVRTEADEEAVLRFYLAGYKDAHLNGYLNHTPYKKFSLHKEKWTGWLLKATNTGYVVVYRKDGNVYPPENALLLSCDGQVIDELLHKHYAPYFDLRWNILQARDSAAKAFTQDRSFTGVLNRPEFINCDFLVDSDTTTYPVEWSSISEEESAAIRAKSNPDYKLPALSELAPGKIWVQASDFALRTPAAAQSQNNLLKSIASIREKKLVVLDTRGNRGGSSLHGINIFNAIFDNDEKAKKYLLNKFHYKNQGSTALFRASWQLYWSYDYDLKNTIKNQGEKSDLAIYKQQFLARLKQALDAGEQTLYQDEPPTDDTLFPVPTDTWESSIKLILITDKTCVSACLDFVDLVKLVPNLLHLGEPTNADTAYTEIAYMQSQYFKETYNFMVPVKKFNKRLREDNRPYEADVVYEGDMNDDKTLEQWVLAEAEPDNL